MVKFEFFVSSAKKNFQTKGTAEPFRQTSPIKDDFFRKIKERIVVAVKALANFGKNLSLKSEVT